MNFSTALLLGVVLLQGIHINAQDFPPPHKNLARMARYIIHVTDWVSIATISTLDKVKGYPFVTLKSMSDGPINNGTGVPYLYLTDRDLSGQDVLADNRITIMCSLAEVDYCKSQKFDPQDPRCAKLIITGKLVKVDNSTAEYKFGINALYSRHPAMKYWPMDHQFYVAKVDIEQVAVLDYFGGVKLVPIDQYFHPDRILPRDNIFFEEVKITHINGQVIN